MNTLTTIARILLGLIFFVFGLNGFLNFMPMPPMSEAAGKFIGGLAGSGYFFPFLKGTEVLMGALLLANKKIALALTILAPIILNIFLFDLFLNPAGLGMSLILIVLEGVLVKSYIELYKPLLMGVKN